MSWLTDRRGLAGDYGLGELSRSISANAPRHREAPRRLISLREFPDGVVQVSYAVVTPTGRDTS